MNRTELAQALAKGYNSREYQAIMLILNELTDAQLQKAVKIYRKVTHKTN